MFRRSTLRAFPAMLLFAGIAFSANAQTNLGAACGCKPVGSRATVALSTKADVDGNLIAVNTVLSCDTIYTITDKIYVGDGKSITIAPGTLLKGTTGPAGDANALVISRGGKIIAAGTRECPIVFTASADPMDGSYGISNKGKWGGVVILGKAKNNLIAGIGATSTGTDGVGFMEGWASAESRNLFGMPPGMTDDNDNSGIMTFVSIRHAGDIQAADKELNGLTLGSVGRGTTLSNIEVVSNLDDGIEFFGGSVDLKYASVLFNDDDGFDWDLGWSGRGQFWVVVKTDLTTASGGDNGFELDSDDGLTCTFHANPKIYNATFIGAAGINGGGVDNNQAVEWKEASRGEIYNSVFSRYNRAIQFGNTTTHFIDADGSGPGAPVAASDCYAAWNAGTLKLINNTFIGTVDDTIRTSTGPNDAAADKAKFIADGNAVVGSVSGFASLHNMNVTTNAVTTQHDLIPGSNITPTSAVPVGGWYIPSPYRGAFEAGKKSWLSDYTINALIGLQGNLLPCPADLNTDGTTNTDDFLLLIGAFGTSCE